ncbi:MAG: carbohydrate porin [Myxococcota bacterium]
MRRPNRLRCLVAVFVWGLGVPAMAGASPRLGGPDAVENQLERDEQEKPAQFELEFLQPYRDWKAGLQENTGLHFGGDYSAQAFLAEGSAGDDFAAGGMFRFFGSWELVDRGGDHPGALVWKVEHRHGYTDVPPSGFGFDAGYVGLVGPPFSDQSWRTTNLYWRQRFAQGRFTVIAGFLDATDYLDVYALASPWTGFTNLAFSTGSASIALPNDALLGIAAGGMITDNFYVIAGFGDSNWDPEDPFEGFETFFEDHEYFSSVEVGWTASHQELASDNVHVTLWHVDERESAGTPRGWGVNVSATKVIRERWMPFLRVGWADEGGSLLDRTVSTGFSYQAFGGRDLVGLGLNWGRPNKDTFGPGLDDQWTVEFFYRWQILRELAITPTLQLMVDPALNPDENAIWMIGLRVRYAL